MTVPKFVGAVRDVSAVDTLAELILGVTAKTGLAAII